MITTPLRLFDFCLETDGAADVTTTAAERAKDGPKRAVLISAVSSGLPPGSRPGVMFPVLCRDVTEIGGRQASEILWRRAGFGPKDVDVAQIYDCFTIMVILQLEAFGFCGRGEGSHSPHLARSAEMEVFPSTPSPATFPRATFTA